MNDLISEHHTCTHWLLYPEVCWNQPLASIGPAHTLVCVFREYYITMVKWATSTKVAVTWLNRAQNVSILTLCDATTGVCTKVQLGDREVGEGMAIAGKVASNHLERLLLEKCES